MWYHRLIIFSSFLCLAHSTENEPDESSVIIIGAGASGIAAAIKLIENNITNIRILEAEDRIGGRVNSVYFGGGFIDLGAEWCQGEVGNTVYSMVKDLNILKPINYSERVYYSDGQLVDEQLIDEIKNFTHNLNAENVKPLRKDISLGEQYITLFKSSLLEKYKDDEQKLKIMIASLEYSEKQIISYESALSWYDVSYDDGFEDLEGNQVLPWNGKGYKTILDIMLNKLSENSKQQLLNHSLKLSAEVSKISWSQEVNSKVIVETVDGTLYRADQVIVTPSVGVLKAQKDTMFDPKLPDDKKFAIENLGYGTAMKVVMHFSEVWWESEEIRYSFMWAVDDKFKTAVEFKEGPILKGESWVQSLVAIYQSANNPNVMIAWFSGPFVPHLEKESDEVITNGIMYTLKKFLGKKFTNIPKPDKILRSKWTSNPHFRGTYSFDTPKSIVMEPEVRKTLSEPLKRNDGTPAVLFGGEATNPIHFGLVNGAIDVGFREADRIIALLKSNI